MVICLERGADLHMAQLMPLPLTVKSRLVLPFWYWLTHVVLEKRPLNGCSSSSSNDSFHCCFFAIKKFVLCVFTEIGSKMPTIT